MTSKVNLPERVRLARAGLPFAKVVSRVGGLPRVVSVPGISKDRYEVIVKRRKRDNGKVYAIETECRQQVPGIGHMACPGNQYGTICRHSMTALMLCAREQGVRLAWCAKRDDAERRERLGGRALGVNGGKIWCVYWREK